MIFPWTPLDKPSSLPARHWGTTGHEEYSWDDWERDNRSKYPVRYFWQESLPEYYMVIKKFFKDIFYYIRTHTYNKYHLIDARCPTWGLEYKWGWCDRCELILIAPFQILKDFVEKELPHSYVDWDATEHHKAAYKEIQELYAWWMTGRKNAWKEWQDNLDKLVPMSEEYRSVLQQMDDLEAQDNIMLDRLVKIRGFLWT